MKKTKKQPAEPAVNLKFRFPYAIERATEFRETLYGYGPDDEADAFGDVVTAKVYKHQVPAVVAMAYAEGGELIQAEDDGAGAADDSSIFLIEVRELPGKRGRPGRRIGFVSGDDFVSDLRDDDEIIDDPLGDVWGSREEAEEIMHSLIDSLGWPTLVDLEVIELVPAGEDE